MRPYWQTEYLRVQILHPGKAGESQQPAKATPGDFIVDRRTSPTPGAG
jgi:hypothetical protein